MGKVVKSLSRVRLFVTSWTSPSMGFSMQEYWSGLPFPSPGDLPDPRIEPGSPALEANALTSEPPGKPHRMWRRDVYLMSYIYIKRARIKFFICLPESIHFGNSECDSPAL